MEESIKKAVAKLYSSVERKHCKAYRILKDGVRNFFSRDLGEPIISGADLDKFFREVNWEPYLSCLPERVQDLFTANNELENV